MNDKEYERPTRKDANCMLADLSVKVAHYHHLGYGKNDVHSQREHLLTIYGDFYRNLPESAEDIEIAIALCILEYMVDTLDQHPIA